MKIHAIGGYDEVGKNMTALEIGEDVILFDAGLFLPAVIGVSERERERVPTEKGMRALGALPDDLHLDKLGLRDKVRAIVVSHAHLDHVGAIQYLASRYRCPILGSPFTMEFLKILLKDSSKNIPNRIIPIKMNSSFTVKGKSGNYKIELVNMTHSTIHSTMVAVHTKEGVVLYANDYKLDNAPTFGDKPNYKRFKELSKIGIKALVVDCLYAPDDRKTPSEKIAKGLLEDVLFTTDHSGKGLIISTFSSHIARLKTIVDLGKKINRKVIFLGRSLNKYVTAANNVGMAPFKRDIQILTYRKQMERVLRKINKNKKDFLIVCTGHQGEPGSVLDRISRGNFPLTIDKEDHIILSSKLIPSPINEERRTGLQSRLKKKQARIFDEVHVSGHGGREDLRDLLKVLNPQHVIPSHGEEQKRKAGCDLSQELGYKLNKTVHMMSNKQSLKL